MLRYLVLLSAGGVYSDADTRALMPLARWADGAQPFLNPPMSTRHDQGERQLPNTTYPIRIIVSIEGDFHVWRDKVAL